MALNTGEITALRFMFNDTRIGGRHCGLREIQRGFPTHERGSVEGYLRKLVKLGLVTHHPTHYGTQYSINPRMIHEVKENLFSTED